MLAIDEPPETRFGMLLFDYEKYKQDFPDYPYYINLLPVYSDLGQLGWVDYKEHLRSYKETLLKNYDPRFRVLMCDSYPLKDGPSILEDWLYNLEMLRQIATETNSDLYLFLQDQGFWGSWRQPTTLAELTFQFYVYLAFGAKGVAHYPYLTPPSEKPEQKGIVDFDESKTFMFPLVKALNEEIKKIDGVYLEFEWQGIVLGKAEVSEYAGLKKCTDFKESLGILKSAYSERDLLVGCFENSSGYQAFIAVNFSEPLGGKENKIALKLDGVNKAIVYVKGEPQTVLLNNGIYERTLGLGEGIFIVPYKE